MKSSKYVFVAVVLGICSFMVVGAQNGGQSSLSERAENLLKDNMSAGQVAKNLLGETCSGYNAKSQANDADKYKACSGTVAAALSDAGLTPAQVVAALISGGLDASVATEATIAACGVGSAKDVVAAAEGAAPGQSTNIELAAIAAGGDPTTILPATAAGGGGTATGVALTSPSFSGGGGSTASPR
jgi:hypothetical protein